MGSKKHKKHKSERRDRYDDRHFSLERPPGLKLILKVGGNSSTPEHGSDSPAGIHSGGPLFISDYHEKHKKSKKKKKKKDREKKHKHYHKEKRRHREDSSQEDVSMGEDSANLQETILRYSSISTTHSLAATPVTKPIIPLKKPEIEDRDCIVVGTSLSSPVSGTSAGHHLQTPPNAVKTGGDNHKPTTPGSGDSSGREPRTCVLKLKQSRSPLAKLLDHLLRALEKRDPHQFFAWPVTDDIAPGYSAIITKAMDFSTMRQKIDDNVYTTLQEFGDDFRLMCENAIKYNHMETVYHKAAKRLLHVGARLLQPENLMRSLRPLLGYMRELTPRELGFELPCTENQENESHAIDSADETLCTGAEETIQAQIDEDEKRKAIRGEHDPKSRFEPFIDDLTHDEVLKQVQNAARTVRHRLSARQQAGKIGFLRQNKDGTTSMKILVDTNIDAPEKVISLGAFTGKLQQGTGQLQGFREDRRNVAKIVKPLNYGSFCSFAPVYDSRFSNLSKEESELVLNTYGDTTGADYAESILEFTKDSSYASTMANNLLDIITGGEHSKTIGTLMESQRQKYEEHEVKRRFPSDEEDSNKYENVKVDYDNLRSLSKLGVDMRFLDSLEASLKVYEAQKRLQEQLSANSELLEKLNQVQHDRLSQTLPAHLSHVPRPNSDEVHLASQITSNLTDIAKQLPPDAVASPHGLRKAMGMSTAGLESFDQRDGEMASNAPSLTTGIGIRNVDIDTTSVPMDLEPDSLVHHQQDATSSGPVDLESELREFLEGESGQVEHDAESIEQMLL